MTFGAWAGTVSFGPWWLFYCGPLRRSDPRVHHAFKVVVHGGGPCIVDGTGSMIHGPAVVIEPGRRHAAHGSRDHAVILMVDPASRAGRWLRHRGAPTELGPGHPVGAVTSGLDPAQRSHIDEAVHRTLALAGAPVPLGVSVPVAVRWQRLMAALEHLAEGATIAAAAEHGRYADGAHFEEEFVRLFGVTPKSPAPVRTWFQ